MKKRGLDAGQVVRDVEDRLIPRLNITLSERAIYYHLLRHSRLEGRRRARMSLARLARGTRISHSAARYCLWGLVEKGALQVLDRGKTGYEVELLLPTEIAECRPLAVRNAHDPVDLETADFYSDQRLAEGIHQREGGRCFYCRRELMGKRRALDHVVPRRLGRKKGHDNSYRNLVSCCGACNLKKADKPAPEFLRTLYREGRLNPQELSERLAALKMLRRGKLKPEIGERLARCA